MVRSHDGNAMIYLQVLVGKVLLALVIVSNQMVSFFYN